MTLHLNMILQWSQDDPGQKGLDIKWYIDLDEGRKNHKIFADLDLF